MNDEHGKNNGLDGDGTNRSSETRRRTLRQILAGTGILAGAGSVSSKWSKPVIDSITLPAHAQTSPGATG